MPKTSLYTLTECIDLMKDCRLDELVALSTLLIEEWQSYTIDEQVQLLPALVKRREELQKTPDHRNYIYFKGRGNHFDEPDPE